MPTIVSYPKSHAFRLREGGKPGAGQLWNKMKKCYEEPTLEEKEQLLGYNMGDTMGGLATRAQRSRRLGQAMDCNTMKWLGAFLYAEHVHWDKQPRGPPDHGKYTIGISTYFTAPSKAFFSFGQLAVPRNMDETTDPHHQACEVVEQILMAENLTLDKHVGGGDIQPNKKQKKKSEVLTEMEPPGNTPDRAQSTITKNNWKVGAKLTERDQLDVLKVLSENNDRFAYSIEELSLYTGPPMEIHINSKKNIFRPPHRLGEKELIFVGEQCENLFKLGFIRRSDQSKYASATVVVRKKDENGDYTDLRKCGDYRPLNLETKIDRYQLPLIKAIFNDMKGAKIFTKLDLRSGYHQMP